MTYSFSKTLSIKGNDYTFKAPSTTKYKKYDVFLDDKKLLSFGDNRYEQFRDKLGFYKDKDHGDLKRKRAYRLRHQHDNISEPNSPGYFSFHFLWT
jgi:hypothetical protein